MYELNSSSINLKLILINFKKYILYVLGFIFLICNNFYFVLLFNKIKVGSKDLF
jgi:hypothetical protein